MKILVTGAGGFIGGHLVSSLLKKKHKVICADIKPKKNWFQIFKQSKNYSLDLSNLKNCLKLTKNIGIRFFLQFPDVFTHFDVSLLHEQIKKDDFNSVSLHTHLESNVIGKKLCRVIEKCKYVKSTTCSTHV